MGSRKKADQVLVLEHLERVSWRILEECPDIIRQMIRGRHGVYALYRRDKLYYIGLATNLMGRLKSHLKDRHHGEWDRFSVYLTAHAEHIKEMESLLLRITMPSGNKQCGKFRQSECLLALVNRLLTEADADRRAALLGGTVARRRRRSKARKAKGSLALKGAVERGARLLAEHGGERYHAMLRPDGQLRYEGVLFTSPSSAARAAIGRTANGWSFWKYKDPELGWMPLNQLRK